MAKKRAPERDEDEEARWYAHTHGDDGAPAWGDDSDKDGHAHRHDDEGALDAGDDGDDALDHRHGEDGGVIAPPDDEDDDDDDLDDDDEDDDEAHRGLRKGTMGEDRDKALLSDTVELAELIRTSVAEGVGDVFGSGVKKALRKALTDGDSELAKSLGAMAPLAEAVDGLVKAVGTLTTAVNEQAALQAERHDALAKALSEGTPLKKAVDGAEAAGAAEAVPEIKPDGTAQAGEIGKGNPDQKAEVLVKAVGTDADTLVQHLNGDGGNQDYTAVRKAIDQSYKLPTEKRKATGITSGDVNRLNDGTLDSARAEAIVKAVEAAAAA